MSLKERIAIVGTESSPALLRANRLHTVELISPTLGAWEKSIWQLLPKEQKERIIVVLIIEMQTGHVVDHIKDFQTILQSHQGQHQHD